MKILLYGLNYAPELTGIGKYSGEMCEWLAANGHEVRVICAPPYYPEWRVGKGYKSWQYRQELINNVTVIRCPLFVPKAPKILNRLIHLSSFAVSSLPALFKQWFWKPEVVITIEPTFFCTPGALLFSKLRGSKSLLHIQDFELDAMLGLGMVKASAMAKFARALESWFMRRFDAISTISYSMLKKAEEKTGQPAKLFYFPNGVDTSYLKPEADPTIFRKRWNISELTRVVLYAGNMGNKQGLEIVVQAAERLKSEANLLFIMVGTGSAKAKLFNQAEQLELTNLKFHPLQYYEELPSLMALATVHLVIQKKGAADAVLPSKLTSIFSVGGNSIITAESDTELGILCNKYPGIAECIEPENVDALVDTIKRMLYSPRINGHSYNKVARQFALENLKKENILTRLVNRLIKI
jgi:colanic acid biosynthesis glycosyl transferase WcaI